MLLIRRKLCAGALLLVTLSAIEIDLIPWDTTFVRNRDEAEKKKKSQNTW